MLNFLYRDDFQNTFVGAAMFGTGFLLYKLLQNKRQCQKQIDFIKRADIKGIKNFINQQQQRINSTSYYEQEKYSEQFLIKMIPKMSEIVINRKIYSNEIQFCEPSLNPMIKDFVSNHNKQHVSQKKQLKYVLQSKQGIQVGIIATDKLQPFQATYFSRNQLAQMQEQNFKEFLQFTQKSITDYNQFENYRNYYDDFKNSMKLSFWERTTKSLKYFIQSLIQFFQPSTLTKKRRSFNQKRAPLLKGAFSGILQTKYKFLQNTNFLLKIKIQGKQIASQIVGDNKTSLVKYFIEKIFRIKLKMCGFSLIFACLCAYQLYSISKNIKVLLLKANLSKKYFNPKGISQDKMCQICYANSRNVIFYECRHYIICYECYQHHPEPKCILCSGPVDKIQLVCSN